MEAGVGDGKHSMDGKKNGKSPSPGMGVVEARVWFVPVVCGLASLILFGVGMVDRCV